MKPNIKTVIIDCNYNLSTIDGTYASLNYEHTHFKLPLIDHKPLGDFNVVTSNNSVYFLMNGTFRIEYRKVLFSPFENVSVEDMPYYNDLDVEEIMIPWLELDSKPDDKMYYVFYIDTDAKVSLSKDFKILKENYVPDLYISEKYQRVIYASLNKDVPLAMDDAHCVCISPFAS